VSTINAQGYVGCSAVYYKTMHGYYEEKEHQSYEQQGARRMRYQCQCWA
jgi:hypothetical protein